MKLFKSNLTYFEGFVHPMIFHYVLHLMANYRNGTTKYNEYWGYLKNFFKLEQCILAWLGCAENFWGDQFSILSKSIWVSWRSYGRIEMWNDDWKIHYISAHLKKKKFAIHKIIYKIDYVIHFKEQYIPYTIGLILQK